MNGEKAKAELTGEEQTPSIIILRWIENNNSEKQSIVVYLVLFRRTHFKKNNQHDGEDPSILKS